MTLVTPDLLRKKLGLKADQDDEVQRLLSTVIALWEQQTNRLWTRRVDHEQLIGLDDENDRRRVLLYAELYPIETVEVREFDDVEDPDDVTLLDLIERTDYKLTKSIGEIKRIRFSPGFAPRKVSTNFAEVSPSLTTDRRKFFRSSIFFPFRRRRRSQTT